MIRIDVLGSPAPKGSARAIMRGGYAQLVAGSSDVGKRKMLSWESAVREQAHDFVSTAGPAFVEKALAVTIVFRLQRPASHWSKKPGGGVLPTAPVAPRTKPDIDKLARSTLDALTGSVFDDDARIVELMVRKEYARPGLEGATIVIDEWRPTP